MLKHKIFHPTEWHKVDWITAVINIEIGVNNADSFDNLWQRPILILIAFIASVDWFLFRTGLNFPRTPIFVWAAVCLPMYLRLKHKIGKSELVKRIQRRRNELGRTHNDIEMEEHLKITRKLYDNITKWREEVLR